MSSNACNRDRQGLVVECVSNIGGLRSAEAGPSDDRVVGISVSCDEVSLGMFRREKRWIVVMLDISSVVQPVVMEIMHAKSTDLF
jgi:chemotaxis signal transduction protein